MMLVLGYINNKVLLEFATVTPYPKITTLKHRILIKVLGNQGRRKIGTLPILINSKDGRYNAFSHLHSPNSIVREGIWDINS